MLRHGTSGRELMLPRLVCSIFSALYLSVSLHNTYSHQASSDIVSLQAIVTSQYLYYAAANMLGTKGKTTRAVSCLVSTLTPPSTVYTNSVIAAYALFLGFVLPLRPLIYARYSRLNFRRPRKPAMDQNTGIFTDIKLAHTSSSGTSLSRDEDVQSKVRRPSRNSCRICRLMISH